MLDCCARPREHKKAECYDRFDKAVWRTGLLVSILLHMVKRLHGEVIRTSPTQSACRLPAAPGTLGHGCAGARQGHPQS